jgi:hypothetical protein
MQPEYETVVEAGALLSTGIPFLIHLVVVSSQLFLSGYVLVQGCAAAARPDPASYGLRGLGSVCAASLGIRGFGFLEIAAGLLLLAPLSLGWPTLASGLACVLALTVLFILGWREAGVGRRVAVAAAVLTLGFMIWRERIPRLRLPASHLSQMSGETMNWIGSSRTTSCHRKWGIWRLTSNWKIHAESTLLGWQVLEVIALLLLCLGVTPDRPLVMGP